LELGVCVAQVCEFFKKNGYPIQTPITVVRNNERTLFASTAGQVYDDLIYGTTVKSVSLRCVVSQPVIRLQGVDIVALIEGVSTSFIHTATEQWNVDAHQHFVTFDHWLDFFSSIGLHVGSLCFKVKQVDNDWSGKTVTSEMVKINYGGLEIGVANLFFNIPQGNNSVATLSDIGFGVERIVWAINKSTSYFDSIGPLSYVIILERVMIDAIRTVTLMVASGVVPGNKNQGSKLRSLINVLRRKAQFVNLYELVRYYHAQWTSLISLPVSFETTYIVIWQEINRALNLETNHMLGINEPFNQTHEDFLRLAIQKKVVSISRIRDIARRKTT
jgi:hypothetical protein